MEMRPIANPWNPNGKAILSPSELVLLALKLGNSRVELFRARSGLSLEEAHNGREARARR
jgi:hypothetical protein